MASDGPDNERRAAGAQAPDGGWGWVVLVATMLVLALTLAFPSCVGIFYNDLQRDFHASNSQTSWVPSIMTAALHAGGPVCSVLLERLGCRATVMLGGVLSGLGMAASSFTHSIGQLYVTAGVITGLGFCLSYQPAVTILGQYFVRRRAFANAVSSTGTALGLCTLPVLANFLHGELGWRGSFLVLGGVLLNCCVCGAVMRPLARTPTETPAVGCEPSPESGCVGTSRIQACVSKHMALDQLLHNRRYRVYAVAITWTMLGFVVPLIYLVPYATDNRMEAGQAASLLSVLGLVNIAVRPPAGVIFNLPWFRGRHVYVFSGALLVNGLSNAVCCLGPTFPVLLSYVLLYGLSMSVVGSLMFTVLMDVVDMSRFASALGLLAIMESVTLLVGPPLAGILVDSTGQYFYVFLTCSAIVASAAIFLVAAFWWMDADEHARRGDQRARQEESCHDSVVDSLVVCRPPGCTMSSVILSGFLLLFVDATLTWTLWSGLRGRGASAAEQWGAAALKWALLDVMTRAAAPKKQQVVLRRLGTLLVLLPCLLRSGSELEGDPVAPPGLSGQLQVSLCSALSCLFWETAFSGGGGLTEEGKVAPDTHRLLARLLQQFRPDFLLLTAGCGFIILTVACDTLIPLFQGTVMDVLRGRTLDSSFYTTLGILACFFVGSCIFSGLRSGSFMITHARLNKRLRMAVFRTVLSQEVLFFQENQPANLCSRLQSDVHQLGLMVSLNFNAVLRSSIKTLLMLVAMLYESRPLTALACVEIPVLAALQSQQVRYHKELKEQKQDSLARLKELSHQSLGGIHTVRSFHGQSDEAQRFHRELQLLQEIKIRDMRHKAFFTLLRRLGSLVTKMVMLLAARSLVSGGQLSGGTLLTFLLYRKPMSHNLKEIFVCCGDTLATLGIISKVFSYLDRSPKRRADGHLAPDALRGEIVFQNVTFGYPSAAGDEPALKDVSMVLEAGKVTALVGPSGSGKTSCVGLLKRLYDPRSGDILLDGQPLHAYDNAYLHRKVVSVPQNPVLMRGSLRYNVEYGLEDCDLRRVREVAAKIKADQLLAKLEADYDADVGEGGAHLSEGDKQSVALLRAMVRQPRVLLLDEATSQMDAHTQHGVLEEVVRCGCTVLMVAHRLRSVERADRVIFMENGVVMEEGTHAQLMAMGGRYQGLRQELSDQRP